MEAPFDGTKTNADMLNFSGSASDMMAAMAAAGIVVDDAKDVISSVHKNECAAASLRIVGGQG